MFNNELISKTESSNHCPLSTVPRPRYHLLHMPPKGGKPMMLRLPIRNAPKVIGMARPSPPMSLTSLLFAATRIAPAAKNKVILANACMEKGFLVNCIQGRILRFVPPLVVEKSDIDALVADGSEELLEQWLGLVMAPLGHQQVGQVAEVCEMIGVVEIGRASCRERV